MYGAGPRVICITTSGTSSVNDLFDNPQNNGCLSFDHSIQYVERVYITFANGQPTISHHLSSIYRHIFENAGQNEKEQIDGVTTVNPISIQ